MLLVTHILALSGASSWQGAACATLPGEVSPRRCPQGGAPRPLGHTWVCLGTACGEQGRLGLCPGAFKQHPNVPSAHSSVSLMEPRPPITSGTPVWQQLPDKQPGFGFPTLGQGARWQRGQLSLPRALLSTHRRWHYGWTQSSELPKFLAPPIKSPPRAPPCSWEGNWAVGARGSSTKTPTPPARHTEPRERICSSGDRGALCAVTCRQEHTAAFFSL